MILPNRNGIVGFFQWKDLVFGLCVREVRSRFARGNVGYAWAYLIPAAWIGGLILFFEFLGHRPAIHVPVPYFVATGMLPYVIFRQTITGMTRSLAASRSILGLGGTRQSDVYFAAAWLELLNATVLCTLIMLVLAMVFGPIRVADVAGSTLAILLAWFLGASFGRLSAVLGSSSDFVARILPVALRPMFWISGIFFTAAEIPEPLRTILWFNPLLHIVELLRSSVFDPPQVRFFDAIVPITAIALFYLASIAIQRKAHNSSTSGDFA